MTWMTLAPPGMLLAQAREQSAAEVVWWTLALILAVLVMGVVILLVRQRNLRKRKEEGTELVYTLHDLRKMLRRGEITQEEFEKLKEIVNTRTRQMGPLGR